MSSGRKKLLAVVLSILCLAVLLSGCKQSQKDIWRESSARLKEVSQLCVTLSRSLNARGLPMGSDEALKLSLVAFDVAFNGEKCLKAADKLDVFIEFEPPTADTFAPIITTVDEMMKATENWTTNENILPLLRADERRSFIKLNEVVKQTSEMLDRTKPEQ